MTLSQDIFNHIVWKNKIPTEASLSASKDILPDMSSYYSKFTANKGPSELRGSAAGGGIKGKSTGPRR